MGKSLPLGLALVLLIHCCAAQLEQITGRGQQQQQQGFRLGGGRQQQQRHSVGRSQFQEQCQIENLNPLEPSRRIQAEAGFSEIWDVQSAQELQCAGVGAIRHVIQPRGLMLPAFANSPELMYVVQGRGLQGVPFPGCRNTYLEQEESDLQSEREGQGDAHQKVRRIREGDVLALPAGALHWFYNDGQSELVLVSVLDTASQTNQLDQTVRNFFIAGNPQTGGRRGGQMFGQGRQGGRRGDSGESFGNIFNGFDDELLSETYNVEEELARRLRGEDDQRGHIVEVQNDLQIVGPQFDEEEEEEEERRQGGRSRWSRQGGSRRGSRWERSMSRRGGYNGNFTNGIEETFCTMRLKENINNPVRADVYNPQAGRITTLNSFSLSVLDLLQLSMERGVLHRDAILAPHYHVNCHGIIYVTAGNARVQIVDDSGRNVFDGELQEGQLLVVPQNFVVIKRAGQQGFNYVSFRTNSDGLVNTLTGRSSALRGLPVEVIMNSYDVSREEAQSLKDNRQEFAVLSPGSRSGLRWGRRGMQDDEA